MSSPPKFHADGTIDMVQVQQALTTQTEQLKAEIQEVKAEVDRLNKNIEKMVDVLNQTNPRAKNLMIRSYTTSGVVSNFIK